VGTIAKPPLWRMTGIELLVLILLALALLTLDQVQAYSLLAGGLIQVAGTVYFARLAFRHRGGSQLARSIQSMYRGEAGKIMLSALFFMATFIFVKPLGAVAFFAGYGVMVLVHTAVAATLLQRHKP